MLSASPGGGAAIQFLFPPFWVFLLLFFLFLRRGCFRLSPLLSLSSATSQSGTCARRKTVVHAVLFRINSERSLWLAPMDHGLSDKVSVLDSDVLFVLLLTPGGQRHYGMVSTTWSEWEHKSRDLTFLKWVGCHVARGLKCRSGIKIMGCPLVRNVLVVLVNVCHWSMLWFCSEIFACLLTRR